MHKFNNCVKVQFEIGHEASLRSEVTPQGFTHDWLVFVRGADNTEIHHFVEKVVFHLHESFPKPKRVVKEPPYEVRESGYASFTFPIEVYLKTKDEPRKLDFIYDLSLNTSGPIRTSQREKRIFNNPSEEFRRKLIRGGGVGVGPDMLPLTDNNSQHTDEKVSSKKSSDSTKKHKSKESVKPEEIRSSSQFADLFGTPIKTAKLSPTTAPKKSESKHSSDSKASSKSTSKHSPHKEKEKEKESSKKDIMMASSNKEKEKERERSKDREKKLDKGMKRPPSPTVSVPPSKTIKEESKKMSHDETKEKEKVKSSSGEVSKSEKKEKKKDKKNRDEKDKKDRHKESEIKKDIPLPIAPIPQPPPVIEKEKEKVVEKPEKNKSEFKDIKDSGGKKSPKHNREDKVKEKSEKDKTDNIEKQRHKHKKKEKSKKEDKEPKEKEKDKAAKKIEKFPPTVPVPKEPSPPPQPPPVKPRARSPSPKLDKPLLKLISELSASEKGSNSDSSAEEDDHSEEKMKISTPSPPPPAPTPPIARTPERVKEEKSHKEKVKKKEKKSSSKDEEGSRKKKRKIKEKEESIPEKVLKLKPDEEPKIIREEPMEEDAEDRLSESSVVVSPQREDQEVSRSRSPTPPTKFTEEYVSELKDLQQKIMTLEDNAELQRVVQVIAETGQYEITKKTFDFDLCALDKSTVKRLQDLFFAAS